MRTQETLGQRFSRIRSHYHAELPHMLDEHERSGRVHFDPYRLDFVPDMTPIEAAVWSDIRCAALPFFPQMPVLRYFLDFADPFKKIGIECDGKEWHDAAKDAERDANLQSIGWIIYRIPGWKCLRIRTRPQDLLIEKMEQGYSREEAMYLTAGQEREWFSTTSEGCIEAIRRNHYSEPVQHQATTPQRLSDIAAGRYGVNTTNVRAELARAGVV